MSIGKVIAVWALLPVTLVGAKPHENFAERPSKRAERQNAARVRAERDKAEVRAWARARGIERRHDDGENVNEIIAVRDGRPIIYSTSNSDAAISVAADAVRDAAPYFADGGGVTVGVWDGGLVKTNHQEFGGRVDGIDSAVINYHATHVAGTIAASGVVARAEGMAPSARIASRDWNFDEYEMISSAAAAPGQPDKLYLSNHSYGIVAGWFFAYWMNPYTRSTGYHWWGDITADTAERYFGQYGAGPRDWDAIVYDAPYFLPFKAAGNERDDTPTAGATVYYTPDGGSTWTNAVYDPALHPLGDGTYKNGYDTIPYLGNAKNILTVSAVTDAKLDGTRDLSVVDFPAFASWGPADDGRIKPDIVANGDQLYSCDSRNTAAYATRSGTSMSAPNATGSAALLVDLYDDLFPGQAPRASSLKGLIIHTADDLGRPGPDYQYGWGLMNTRAAAALLKDLSNWNSVRLSESRLDAARPEEVVVAYSDGGEPIRVTLCWTDPPGTATSGLDDRRPALVNDLDLLVVGPGGTRYPFSLDPARPEAVATADAKNLVDNVEQVLIPAGEPGLYTISIRHDGALADGAQDFSLITSGLFSDDDEDGMPDNWEANYFLTAVDGLPTDDADGDGVNNYLEYVSGTDPTDPNSIFGVTGVESISSEEDTPFVIRWNALPGRVYNVYWTYNLRYVPFENISGELRWPINSHTDRVDRIGDQGLYQIDVRLDRSE